MNAPASPACRTADEPSANDLAWRASVLFVWIAGLLLRVTQTGSTRLGFDENLYRIYVDGLRKGGLASYPEIVESYIAIQKGLPGSILPPMRFIYIFTSYLWTGMFGGGTLTALHDVSRVFSVLTLTLSFVFALRLGGKAAGLAVLALVACAPTQIQMSQHALVDGVFTFWALLVVWTLWENLRRPGRSAWLLTYTAALAVMVMTKENAFFVFVGVVGILAVNRWARFGTVTPRLLFVTFAGPLIGLLLLIFLAGGPANFIETYHLSVTKNYTLPYAILTGDGPWYRYLVDLLLVSPLVLILAIGEIFKLREDKKAELYLVAFAGFSYVIMANVKYGMNLRYANMWDMPLRFLAFANLVSLAALFGKRRDVVLVVAVVALCAFELRQYYIFFVQAGLYEFVSEGLLRAVNILKVMPR